MTVLSYSLRVQGPVLRRTEVRQQHGHLVERSPPDGLVVSTAREIVSNLLLVDPEQAVKRHDIGVTDERQAVVTGVQRLAVGRYLDEKPPQHKHAIPTHITYSLN